MKIKQTTLALAIAALAQGAMAQQAIEEITVTAQKRSQSLQDVGIAVSAFGSEQLKELGTSQPVELSAQTPNLTTKNAAGNTAPIFAIRGISLNDFASNGTQPVGVYVDEVYLSNNSQLSFQMFDTERVEVLKGPQGTLYGRNTTAGAVNFISRKPTEDFEANLEATIGDYDLYKTEGYISGEITEGLSGRFSAAIERQGEGFYKNEATGKDQGKTDRKAWRGLLSWDASDNVNVLFNLHGGTDNSENIYYKFLSTVPGGVQSAIDALNAAPKSNDIHNGFFNTSPDIDNEAYGGSATINWEINDTLSLASISAYDEMDYSREEEYDSTLVPQASENTYTGDLKQYSQEFRLLGGNDSWNWILGAFYGKDELEEHDRYNTTNHPIFFGLTLLEDYKQDTTSAAIYTHNEIQLNDELKLTVGLRYTDEERTFDGGSSSLGFGLPSAVVKHKITSDEVTGRLGLDYFVNDDLLIYGNYSRGYKSGGVSGLFAFVAEEKDPYEPEYVDAYEVGFKSTLADGSLQLNGAAFFYKYTDLQRAGFINGNFNVYNIDESEIKGVELDLWWRPAEGLDIKLGMGYLDSEVTKSTLPNVSEGNTLANAPELQLSTMVGYEWELNNELYAKVVVDASWQDDVSYTSADDSNKLQQQDAYSLVNGRIIIGSNANDWTLSLWGKNLGDKEYFSEIYNDDGIVPGFAGAPRTFGLTASKNW